MTRPKHLFLAGSDLFDTRNPQWHTQSPLRTNYEGHVRNIKTVADLKACLRAGAYTDHGGYPIYFICSDGEPMHFNTARENFREIAEAIKTDSNCGWRIVGCEVNYEDSNLFCVHSSDQIDVAYGDN